MVRPLAALALLLVLCAPALAQRHAHQHGVARLDIAIDAKTVSVGLHTPLDNLLGFERAPRTDAEKQLAGELLARLKDGDALLFFDPAAGCKQALVTIDAAVLGLGGQGTGSKGEHAELQAQYEFQCTEAAQAAFVDVGLFGFKRLQRVQVQLALPKAQVKRELKRPATRLSLRP